MGKSMKIHDLLHFFEAKIDFYEATLECTNKWFQYLRDKKKKERKKGAQKKGWGGGGGENSPISPPLDPRLLCRVWVRVRFK